MLIHRHSNNIYGVKSKPTILMAFPFTPFCELLRYICVCCLFVFAISANSLNKGYPKCVEKEPNIPF